MPQRRRPSALTFSLAGTVVKNYSHTEGEALALKDALSALLTIMWLSGGILRQPQKGNGRKSLYWKQKHINTANTTGSYLTIRSRLVERVLPIRTMVRRRCSMQNFKVDKVIWSGHPRFDDMYHPSYSGRYGWTVDHFTKRAYPHLWRSM